MHLDLDGRVAIVTGGGRGIGRVIARRLAEEGVNVVVADFREDLLDDVQREWAEAGWPGVQVPCDIRRAGDCRSVAGKAEERFGGIDILVNNAGIAGGSRIEHMAEDVWDANLEVNLKGTFLMCQAVIPAMKRRGAGRIINASSFAALIPSVGGSAYAASKAGVISLTQVLAGELGPHEITVNCYTPGMIPTGMNRFAERGETDREALLDTLSLRRWGDPEDIASLVCFLASDHAGYITGSTINISGGKFATQAPWAAYRDKR